MLGHQTEGMCCGCKPSPFDHTEMSSLSGQLGPNVSEKCWHKSSSAGQPNPERTPTARMIRTALLNRCAAACFTDSASRLACAVCGQAVTALPYPTD